MSKFICVSIVLVLTQVLNTPTIVAQNVDIDNLGSINIDNLSDDQIRKFQDKVAETGFSEDQLILMAKSKGMSTTQIARLRSRMQELSDENKPTNTNININIDRTRQQTTSDTTPYDPLYDLANSVDSLANLPQKEEKTLAVFGQDFFTNSKLSFTPSVNMSAPPNYVLGTGDELIIDIWGASEQTYQLTISPRGAVIIKNLGPVYVSGMTLSSAKSNIINRLKRIYSSIGSSSYADVSLGKIRAINVHVIGKVNSPGTFTLSSFSTVFNALYFAGGPSEKGSMRQIEVFRNKKLISTFDAYDFLINGTGDNQALQDQDVVIVRHYLSRVILKGAVKNPAIYEIKKGESFAQLMKYAGGFTENAYKEVVNLRRIEGRRKVIKTIKEKSHNEAEINDGDEIYVNIISDEFLNRVIIEGPVYNPGEYELVENMDLKQLIEITGGLQGDIFMDRALIIRQNKDKTLSNLSINLNTVMSGDDTISLKNNDYIQLQSIFSLRESLSVQLSGEVQYPGEFDFIAGMTVEDLIFLAGGFKESAAKSFVEVARQLDSNQENNGSIISKLFKFDINQDLSLSMSNSKFELQPFDFVFIRKSPLSVSQRIVTVEGEAHFPGQYALESKEERISSLLKRAGGITSIGYIEGATLIRRTEYHLDDDTQKEYRLTKNALNIRKEDLKAIFSKDSTLNLDELKVFKQQETIGINLSKIIANPNSNDDLLLREGDILSIPRQSQLIRVRGEAFFPTNIQYKEGASFKYYVSRAGGFNQFAKKSKSYVIYANNSLKAIDQVLFFKKYPKIKPGAEIIIPKREERQKLSAIAWGGLAASLTSLSLVILQILNATK